MNSGFKSEETIFAAALELPPGERPAFLDEACAGNVTLRQAVEALLQSHAQATSFLEQPPPDVTLTRAAMDSVSVTEKIGDQIGRYKLLQQIGEGGCGVVYMAEQLEPVRRQVALKIIKLGMDTKQVIARFEAERQALALMDHPNIAKVLDAGATETGRPYFVMELVRGIKITDFCDKNQFPTEARLKLFIQVCQAVQHAHQKGIIHRDLKPSNILVTLNDGVPLPKVIDFGIAKATQERLTDKTLFTAFEQFLGTPAYMSPEQAEMNAQGVDTRSDIYSLGVLLYELLTGRTPFESQKLLQAGVNEIRRIIREEEPQRPSTKLSTLLAGELTTTATLRQTKPPHLIHTVRGELDWIVMKALEKDRNRRYETANGFAVDVQRHLNNEPVAASPPNRLYKFQKLVRRNKFLFIAVSAVIAALVIGLGIATWMFFNEQQARQQAEVERKTAETEAAKSQQVAQFLENMLNGVGPSVALGRDTTMLKEILDKTAEHVNKDLTNQPEVAIELLNTIGRVHLQLGQFEKAEAMHRQALELSRKWMGNRDETVADSLAGLAAALLPREDRLEETPPMLREALQITREKFGNVNLKVANLLEEWSHATYQLGSARLPTCITDSEALAREALAIRRKLLGNENIKVSQSLSFLGALATEEGRLPEAETMIKESLAINRRLSPQEDLSQATVLNNLANLLDNEGKLAEAESACRDALVIQNKLLGKEHPKTVRSLAHLVLVLLREGKRAEADNLSDEILTRLQNQTEQVAELFARMGRWTNAVSIYSKLPESEPRAHWFYFTLGSLLAQSSDVEGYRQLCAKILMRYSGTTNPVVAERMAKTCLILPSAGVDLRIVDHLADTAVSRGATSSGLGYFQFAKGLAEYRQGRFAEAAVWLHKSIENNSAPEDNRYVQAYAVLAMTEQRMNRTVEARAALAEGMVIEQKLPRLGGDLGGYWMDWIMSHVLLKEAKELVEAETNDGY